MLSKHYSFIVANRTTGVVRRFTLAMFPSMALVVTLLVLSIGWAVHFRATTYATLADLQLRNTALAIENTQYHSATAELSSRIAAVQLAIGELRHNSIVDPRVRRAMERLPKAPVGTEAALYRSVALSTPTDSFNLLTDLLNVLDAQLTLASDGVAQQQAFAAATPINLPADGSVSGRFGYRSDPFTGERAFHPAVDIRTGYGEPVYATADGLIESAKRSGDYGNLVEIDHGFGLVTKYGHLSKFATKSGNAVMRGDVIGYAGATGRATGSHVHYEVWVNGRTMNPLQLGAEQPRSQSAN
jgi:murein DD-endopeptidase MepM/ murein hydrolase activator NlpD